MKLKENQRKGGRGGTAVEETKKETAHRVARHSSADE